MGKTLNLFGDWIAKTKALQIEAFGSDPSTLIGEDRATFVTWNVLAAHAELDEFLDHHQWKPWSNRQGEIRDVEGAEEELVDVLHFVANLAVMMGITDEKMNSLYEYKMEVNRARQAANYDSFGKRE